jgi:hypothetical protein
MAGNLLQHCWPFLFTLLHMENNHLHREWKNGHIRYTKSHLFLQINIVFDRVGKVDPITKGIAIVVHYMGYQIDVRNLQVYHQRNFITQ